jgi:hypothetical protein
LHNWNLKKAGVVEEEEKEGRIEEESIEGDEVEE